MGTNNIVFKNRFIVIRRRERPPDEFIELRNAVNDFKRELRNYFEPFAKKILLWLTT